MVRGVTIHPPVSLAPLYPSQCPLELFQATLPIHFPSITNPYQGRLRDDPEAYTLRGVSTPAIYFFGNTGLPAGTIPGHFIHITLVVIVAAPTQYITLGQFLCMAKRQAVRM